MADTYSQIYIQIVFAVKNRNSLINPTWEEELYKYITGTIQNKGQKMLAINGTKKPHSFFYRDETNMLSLGFNKGSEKVVKCIYQRKEIHPV